MTGTFLRRRPNKLRRVLVCIGALLILLIFGLYALDFWNSHISVYWTAKWSFGSQVLTEDAAETYHSTVYVFHAGPIDVSNTRIASAGPINVIETIPFGNREEIKIFAQEIGHGRVLANVLLYQFDDPPAHSTTSIRAFGTLNGTTNGLHFSAITNGGGSLVAVTERGKPDVVLILKDVATGFDWPGTKLRQPPYWKFDEIAAESLLGQMARYYPSRNFVLGGSAAERGQTRLEHK